MTGRLESSKADDERSSGAPDCTNGERERSPVTGAGLLAAPPCHRFAKSIAVLSLFVSSTVAVAASCSGSGKEEVRSLSVLRNVSLSAMSTLSSADARHSGSQRLSHRHPRGAPPGSVKARRYAERELRWQAMKRGGAGEVRVKLLAFNDFHGHLTSTGRVDGRTLGGAAILDRYFRQASRGFEGRSFIVHAGDLVGASPPSSALYQDEPTIKTMELLGNADCRDGQLGNPKCNVIAGLGNHEFDDGASELRRLVFGGNHANGPFLGCDYAGAGFQFIAANVIDETTGRPLVMPDVVREVQGLKIGFIGAVLTGANWFLTPSLMQGVRFEDVSHAVQRSAKELESEGISAIVVVLHEGGHQEFGERVPRDASAVSGEILRLVRSFPPSVDVVLSGHTHDAIHARLPTASGESTLVTQAFSSGTAFADITLTLDSASGDVVETESRIRSTWTDRAPSYDVPREEIERYVAYVEASVSGRTSQIIAQAKMPILRHPETDGQSALGSIIADAQRAAAKTDFAFLTPAWVRADLRAGPVTWGELFRVQPFGQRLYRVEIMGREVRALLEQQWSVTRHPRLLHASGLSYTWYPDRPDDRALGPILVRGEPLEDARKYTAVANQFLVEGGEGFDVFRRLSPEPLPIYDLDALVAHVKSMGELEPHLDGRIRAAYD